jgi:hypothetical protein
MAVRRLKAFRRPPLSWVGEVRLELDVCLWHITDVPLALTNVCFEGKNRNDADVARCLTSKSILVNCLPSVRINVAFAYKLSGYGRLWLGLKEVSS